MLTSIIVTLNQQCQSKNVRDSLGVSKALKVSSVLYGKTRRNIPTMSCCTTQWSVWLSHLFLLLDHWNAYSYNLTLLSVHPGLQNKLPWRNSIAQLSHAQLTCSTEHCFGSIRGLKQKHEPTNKHQKLHSVVTTNFPYGTKGEPFYLQNLTPFVPQSN